MLGEEWMMEPHMTSVVTFGTGIGRMWQLHLVGFSPGLRLFNFLWVSLSIYQRVQPKWLLLTVSEGLLTECRNGCLFSRTRATADSRLPASRRKTGNNVYVTITVPFRP